MLPLHVVFPGYRPNSFSKSHYNEDVSTKAEDISQLFSNSSSHDIYSIPKPMYHQRADPSSLIIWSTNEITVGIIGTLQGKVVAVDIHAVLIIVVIVTVTDAAVCCCFKYSCCCCCHCMVGF